PEGVPPVPLKMRIDAADVLAFGIKSTAITKTRLAVVGALKITHFGIEVRAYFPVGGGRLVVTIVVPERRKTGVRPARQAWRLSPGVIVLPVGIAPQTHVGVPAKCAVERPLPIKMRKRLTVDSNQTHAGAVGQFPLDSRDGEFIGGSDAAHLARLHAQKAELVTAQMATLANTGIDGNFYVRVVGANRVR